LQLTALIPDGAYHRLRASAPAAARCAAPRRRHLGRSGIDGTSLASFDEQAAAQLGRLLAKREAAA
jgi:hypothetical protein